MYLARYDVECKRYKPNFKSITHLSNVKIRVVHIHYIGKSNIGKQMSIDHIMYDLCRVWSTR